MDPPNLYRRLRQLRTIQQTRLFDPKSTNRRILNASALLAATTVIAKLVGMLKELCIAYAFGASDQIDAFLIAYLPVSCAVTVFAGSFGTSMLPSLVATQDDKTHRNQLVAQCHLRLILVLASVAIILFITAPKLSELLSPENHEHAHQPISRLMIYLLPVLFFQGLASFWTTILISQEQFTLPSLSEIIVSSSIALFALLGQANWGATGIIAGLAFGSLVQWILLQWLARRTQFTLLPSLRARAMTFVNVRRQYWFVVAATLVASASNFIDTAMAAGVGVGSVAVLTFGTKLISVVNGIGSMSFGRAIFPHLAAMVAARQWHETYRSVLTFALLILLITVPLAAIFAVGAPWIVPALFQRGAFTSQMAVDVTRVMQAAALQTPLFVLSILFVRLNSALNQNQVLTVIAVTSVASNILLNRLFLNWIGLPGIALSTACVYGLSLCIAASFAFWGLANRSNAEHHQQNASTSHAA
ncbi:MAG: lipid II flippase MurJ [Pirellulaceae bacterium]